MDFFEALILTLMAGMLMYFAFNVVRRGGFKGAFFGARISSTVGEITVDGVPGIWKLHLRVHALEKNGGKLVGLEIVGKSIMSYEMMPLSLTKAQATELAALLHKATS